MKEQNDIDQLLKSKLNNNSFELKDAYLADFESKLDVYNKKEKGFLWFFLGALCVSALLFYFILLPKYFNEKNTIKTSSYTTTELKPVNFSKISEDRNSELISGSYLKSNDLESKNNLTNKSKSSFTVGKNSTLLNSDKTSNNSNKADKTDKTDKTDKENINNQNSLANQQIINPKEKNLFLQNKDKKTNNIITKTLDSAITDLKIKTPDVYLDDTIRKKVVIIDTIIKRDTIVINDTIKNKIRLFKKKR